MKHRTIAVTAVLLAVMLTACSYEAAAPAAQEAGEEPAAVQEAVEEPAAAQEADTAEEAAVEEPEEAGEPTELVVFAAASLTETLTEIADLYKEVKPEVTLTFNFDSSGTLKTQIEEGAEADVFISAAQKQMDQLDITADKEKNPDGLDFVLRGSRADLLENKVVLAVNDSNPKEPDSFDMLAKGLSEGNIFMAMGNSDVPVGQYTQKILAYYELNEEELAKNGCITYGSNVKEVTTQVSEGLVDCGVIYATDAFSAGLKSVDTATEEMCGRALYPAAVLNVSKDPETAQEFLDYLKGPEATAVFEKVGFTKP